MPSQGSFVCPHLFLKTSLKLSLITSGGVEAEEGRGQGVKRSTTKANPARNTTRIGIALVVTTGWLTSSTFNRLLRFVYVRETAFYDMWA